MTKTSNKKSRKVVDTKKLAANDKPDATVVPTAEAIKARSAGLAQFILAGRPSKSDFIKVYGKRGPAMVRIA